MNICLSDFLHFELYFRICYMCRQISHVLLTNVLTFLIISCNSDEVWSLGNICHGHSFCHAKERAKAQKQDRASFFLDCSLNSIPHFSQQTADWESNKYAQFYSLKSLGKGDCHALAQSNNLKSRNLFCSGHHNGQHDWRAWMCFVSCYLQQIMQVYEEQYWPMIRQIQENTI